MSRQKITSQRSVLYYHENKASVPGTWINNPNTTNAEMPLNTSVKKHEKDWSMKLACNHGRRITIVWLCPI